MISVIIPTYGHPQFLQSAIESVIAQTYKDWELIIVDDNDPDTESRRATGDIVSDYIVKGYNIQYICHEKNKNGAVARNTGFAVAKGDYIALLDSDDEYLPDRLQKCYDAMQNASKSVAGVYTGCEFRQSGKTYNRYTDVKDGNFLVDTLACRFMFCTGSNIFVRKSVIDELDGFDGAFLRHQDYEFLVRVFEKYSLIAIPEILVIKNNENSNLPNLDKQIAIKKQYLDKFHYVIEHLSKGDADYIMHSNLIGIAENAMAQKYYRTANEYYKKAAKFGGLTSREWFRRIAYPFYTLISR